MPSTHNTSGTEFVQKVLTLLFKRFEIGADPSVCASDLAGAAVLVRQFSEDVLGKQYALAVTDLSRSLTALSRSVQECNAPEVAQKLDALAVAVRWANISTGWFGRGAKILVGASDLWDHIEAVAAAVQSKKPQDVGEKLGDLFDAWTAVTGGCSPEDTACKLLDGILRAVNTVAPIGARDVKLCKLAITPAAQVFTSAANAFEQKNYTTAVAQFAEGLELVLQAAYTDACGLKPLADAISNLGPKLQAAVVVVESSGAVKIMVGSADVYNELYAAVVDLRKGDLAGAGLQMGALLAQLRASSCNSKACIVVGGLLSTLQVGLPDFTQCGHRVDATWETFEKFLSAIKLAKSSKGQRLQRYRSALTALGAFLRMVMPTLNECGVPDVASILENTAKSLHEGSLASKIGVVVHFLANGNDISSDIEKTISDFDGHRWAALGQDLGGLSDYVTSNATCNSFTCRLAQGLLREADRVQDDIKPCKDKLREGEDAFTAGAASWGEGHKQSAVRAWGTGLNSIAEAASSCGLQKQVGWIGQEANLLGLGNLTVLSKGTELIVHGSDFYQEFYGAVQDFQNHDYGAAAGKLRQVVDDLSQWTAGHLCTTPACYVVDGILQYVSEFSGDFGKCKADFEDGWHNFGAAYEDLRGRHHGNHSLSNHTRNITAGITSIGLGLQAVANGVGDCHLGSLKLILNQLAAKLLHVPGIVVELTAFLTILIDGVSIVQELANACAAFGRKDWPGFGYNIAKMIKSLLGSGAQSILVLGSKPQSILI